LKKSEEELHEKDLSKEKLKEEFDRKSKAYEAALNKYKQRQKDNDKAAKEKNTIDKKLQDNLMEIEKLNGLIINLKRKSKEDGERFAEIEQRRLKEIANQNKCIDDEIKKSRQLDIKIQMLRKKLDRKTEELAMYSKRHKSSNMLDDSATNMSYEVEKASESAFSLAERNSVTRPQDPGHHERLKPINKRISEIRDQLDEIELKINKCDDQQSLQKLKREKSILVLHVAELQTEKNQLQVSADESADLDDINYAALTERYVDYPEMLEIIPKLRTCKINECRKLVVQGLEKILKLQNMISSLHADDIPNMILEKDRLIKELQGLLKKHESSLFV
jgi:hypothetical protein